MYCHNQMNRKICFAIACCAPQIPQFLLLYATSHCWDEHKSPHQKTQPVPVQQIQKRLSRLTTG